MKTPNEFFFENLTSNPRILELGTLRWGKDSTHHRALFPKECEHIKSDVQAGIDVDIVADAHSLSEVFECNSFDAVFASSVWEHLHSPWIAAKEVLKILKPGGVFYVCTHQTFPIHGYPSDFFRFTDKALEHIFSDASEIVSSYSIPCIIQQPKEITVWNAAAESFILVMVAGKK